MKKWLMAAAVAVIGLAGAMPGRLRPRPRPRPTRRAQGLPERRLRAGRPRLRRLRPGDQGGYAGNTLAASRSGHGPLSEARTGRPAATDPDAHTAGVHGRPVVHYWPYDGHFQTIAPMAHGLYYPPPTYTGNPYMPGQYPGYVPGNPSPAFPVSPAKP